MGKKKRAHRNVFGSPVLSSLSQTSENNAPVSDQSFVLTAPRALSTSLSFGGDSIARVGEKITAPGKLKRKDREDAEEDDGKDREYTHSAPTTGVICPKQSRFHCPISAPG